MRRRPLALLALTCSTVVAVAATACGDGGAGLPNGVVATAGSQSLTVEHMATLLGGAARLNLQSAQARDAARSVANLWADYQLLALSAVRRDSLADPKAIDSALWAITTLQRVRLLGERVSAAAPAVDTTGAGARYASGDVLSARHILVRFPGDPRQRNPQQRPPASVVDSVRRRAEAIRVPLTPANFAASAAKESGDSATATRGGDLGVFVKSALPPALGKAIAALSPGQISQPVESPYGFHIFYRPTYAEIAGELAQSMVRRRRAVVESTYLVRIEKLGHLDVDPDAVLWARSVAGDVEGHTKDDKVMARSAAGVLTAARLARWIESVPEGPMIRAQIPRAPDSTVLSFVRQVARTDLLVRQADTLHLQITPDTVAMMRHAFVAAVTGAWNGIGIAPASLVGASDAERTKTAAQRVDAYLDRLLQQNARYVQLPVPVTLALRERYPVRIDDAMLDQVLARAAQLRATHAAVATPGSAPVNDEDEAPIPSVANPGGMIGSPVRPGVVRIDPNAGVPNTP